MVMRLMTTGKIPSIDGRDGRAGGYSTNSTAPPHSELRRGTGVPGKGDGMPIRSAGIVLYKGTGPDLVLLLVHPGGPFWARKDDGAWSIPKGEYNAGESPAAAARR